MKTLPGVMKTDLESQKYKQALLVYMDLPGEELRYTSWSNRLFYNSREYLSRGMELGSINFSSTHIVDKVSIKFDDVDRALYATLSGNNSGAYPVILTLAVLDSIGKIAATLVVFDGTVDEWFYEPGSTEVVCASVFAQWARVTTSRFSASCRWRDFRGTECQYTGSGIDCDRTYTTCFNFGNQEHFGGFRFTPSMINKRLSIDKK